MRQLRRQVHQRAAACLLADHQYAAGVHLGRRLGWPDEAIFDAVTQISEINQDDPYLAWEDGFGFDQRLLDHLEPGEEA